MDALERRDLKILENKVIGRKEEMDKQCPKLLSSGFLSNVTKPMTPEETHKSLKEQFEKAQEQPWGGVL